MVLGVLSMGLMAAIAQTYAPESTADLVAKVVGEAKTNINAVLEHRTPPASKGLSSTRGKLIVVLLGVSGFVVARKLYRRYVAAVPVQGSTVVVTGASQGIGAAVAEELVARGAKHVTIVARNAAKLDAVCKTINARRAASASFIAADCSVPASVTELAKNVPATPDILINCAGAGHWRFLPEMTNAELKTAIAAPFMSAMLITRAFLPSMLRLKAGTIVNVQSPAGYAAWGGATAYVSARWGLRGLSEALRADLFSSPLLVQDVVLTHTHSAYFENNGGSLERMPAVGKLMGTMSVHEAAAAIIDAIESGEDTRVYGWPLYLTMVAHDWFPWAVDMVVRLTGWNMVSNWGPGAAKRKAASSSAGAGAGAAPKRK